MKESTDNGALWNCACGLLDCFDAKLRAKQKFFLPWSGWKRWTSD